MKKWFQTQQSIVDKFFKKKQENFIKFNLGEKIDIVNSYILAMVDKKDRWEIVPEFQDKIYASRVKHAYRGFADLDENDVNESVNDPTYELLMKICGNKYKLIIDNWMKKKIKKQLQSFFKLNWDKTHLSIFKQIPGQMVPLHFDMPKDIFFSEDKVNPETTISENMTRYIIMLDDQKPGQCFFMGDKFISWKKGDVIGWEHTHIVHGSANFGYDLRYTLVILGPVLPV